MYDNVVAAIKELKTLIEAQGIKIDELTGMANNLKLLRQGQEAFVYGEPVEGSGEVFDEEETE